DQRARDRRSTGAKQRAPPSAGRRRRRRPGGYRRPPRPARPSDRTEEQPGPSVSSSHHLHRVLGLGLELAAGEQVAAAIAGGTAIAEAEAASPAELIGILSGLAMRRRDHEAILVVGNRHDLIHVLDLLRAETDAR